MTIDAVYVECPVCHRIYQGIIPKGGDGTVMRPRRHRRARTERETWYRFTKVDKKTCPGSFHLVVCRDPSAH